MALSWCVSVSKPCKVTKASSKQASNAGTFSFQALEKYGKHVPWLLWGHLVGASGHEVFSLKIFFLKWNLLHGQAVSSSTAPFLSLVAESTRLFMLQSIGGIGKSATS